MNATTSASSAKSEPVFADALEALAGPSRMLAALASIKREHEAFYARDGDSACERIIFSFVV